MAEHVSRRRVLALSGASLLGKLSLTNSQVTTDTDGPVIDGWITKGQKLQVADQEAVVESIDDPSSTLCNGGELYQCRTCSGDVFYLLVGFGTPQPSVGDTYLFTLTGEENWCGNFQVRLHETDPCESVTVTTTDGTAEDGTTETTGTATETTTTEDVQIETTELATTETSTETTETTTETSTETTTEATAEPATETSSETAETTGTEQ